MSRTWRNRFAFFEQLGQAAEYMGFAGPVVNKEAGNGDASSDDEPTSRSGRCATPRGFDQELADELAEVRLVEELTRRD